MRAWILSALMVLVAMSGCLGNNDEPSGCTVDCDDGSAGTGDAPLDDSDSSGDSDGTDDGDDTVGIGAGAYLSANTTGGEAPLDVLFEFGVTEISEDENLTWTFDANGDGTPETNGNGINLQGGGNFTYTFTSAGVFEAFFEATDATGTWNATVSINATEPIEDEGGEEPTESGEPLVTTQEFTGEWLTDNPLCVGGPHDPTGAGEGTSHVTMDVEPGTWGQKFVAEMTGFDAFQMDVHFYDAAGASVGHFSTADGGEFYAIDTAPGVPNESVTAVFYSCLGIGPAVTYSAG